VATLIEKTSSRANFTILCSSKTSPGLQYRISSGSGQYSKVKTNQSAVVVPALIQLVNLLPSTAYNYMACWSGGLVGPVQNFTTLATPALSSSLKPTTHGTIIAASNAAPKVQSTTQLQAAYLPLALNHTCFPGTVVLGRPTNTSITLSLLSNSSINKLTLSVSKAGSGVLSTSKSIYELHKNKTLEVDINGLLPNTLYMYTLSFVQGIRNHTCPSHRFRTQRSKGSSFLFSIIADSHLGTTQHCDPVRYENTLLNVNNANPDFVIFLGDDFRADSVQGTNVNTITNKTVSQLYLNQRPFMSIVAQDAAIYNTNGNHECQEGWLLTSSCNNLPTWAITNRVEYYPNPNPNHFYQGDTTINSCVYGGLQENYYSWSWGDALIVVLDVYLYSQNSGQGWDFSLGINQHLWLSSVLRTASNFKFVFTHHVNAFGRGGVELVPFYEWGGFTPRNKTAPLNEFSTKRPANLGWTVPIQQMLVQNNVTIVFQGHDHLFAKQSWPSDNNPVMLYITLPFPAFPNPANFFGTMFDNSDAFLSGIVRAPAGHLNVEVTSTSVTVSYILSTIPSDANWTTTNNRPTFQVSVVKTISSGQIVVT